MDFSHTCVYKLKNIYQVLKGNEFLMEAYVHINLLENN